MLNNLKMAAPTVTLNNGKKCPTLGLGTYASPPGECAEATKHAIRLGYRHIDAAWLYGNEKEVGQGVREAIAEGLVKREDLFITTKLWNTFHEKEAVLPALRTSLENFGLDYVDLYLIHWPVACKNDGHFDINTFSENKPYDHDFVITWKAMEECVDLGLAKSIGLSNFNSKQVQRIFDNARIKPVMNQIEVTPRINQKKLTAFCMERGIHITAYSPFGSPASSWRLPGEKDLDLNDPELIKIGKKYGKTSAQVILRYLLELGTIPIPKSSNPNRLKLNIEIFDFKLSPEDTKILDSYNCDGKGRVCHNGYLVDSPDYPFKGVEF